MKVIGVHTTTGKRALTDGGAGSASYTGDANLTVGGIASSDTFLDVNMQDMWNDLLHTYYSPAFTSFYLDGFQEGPYEVGMAIPSGNHTFYWNESHPENVKAGTYPTGPIILSGQGFATLTGLTNDFSEIVNFTSSVTRTTPGYRQWTIDGKNTNDIDMTQGILNINWQWRIFYGTSANTILNETQIEALAGNHLAAGRTGTFNLAAGGYKFYAIPDDFGIPIGFKDEDTGFAVAMHGGYSNMEPVASPTWSYEPISITNALGITKAYKLYRTKNILNSDLRLTVF